MHDAVKRNRAAVRKRTGFYTRTGPKVALGRKPRVVVYLQKYKTISPIGRRKVRLRMIALNRITDLRSPRNI